MQTSVPFHLTKRPAGARGLTNLGWLVSRHSFSFGGYHDPAHMGFRSLRVLNDDVVAPGAGFGRHPHRDAEIFSYVISGALEHKDSMGNGRVIAAGDLQYMSAGSGVEHSEFNPSSVEPVHFLQIWLRPSQPGGAPRYEEIATTGRLAPNSLTRLFSPEGGEGVGRIRANAEVYLGTTDGAQRLELAVPASAGVWVQVVRGGVTVAGEVLGPEDGAAVEGEGVLPILSDGASCFFAFVLHGDDPSASVRGGSAS